MRKFAVIDGCYSATFDTKEAALECFYEWRDDAFKRSVESLENASKDEIFRFARYETYAIQHDYWLSQIRLYMFDDEKCGELNLRGAFDQSATYFNEGFLRLDTWYCNIAILMAENIQKDEIAEYEQFLETWG